MKREDIEKLLGGYATNSLTEEERRTLYEAALTDQTLFDALANEEALKEVLEDPRCRRQVEQALAEQPHGTWARFNAWMRRPQSWALAGTLAATVVLAVVVTRVGQTPENRIEVAQRQVPAAPVPAPAASAPAPPAMVAQTPAPARRDAGRLERKLEEPAKLKEFTPPTAIADRLAGPEPQPAPPADLARNAPTVTAMGGAAAPAILAPPAPPKLAAMKPAAEEADKGMHARSGFAETVTVEQETRASASLAKDAKKAATGGFGMVAKQEQQAPLQVRYRILAQGTDGNFALQNPKAPIPQGAQVRVLLEANQAGYLYVNSANGVLLNTKAVPGTPYAVDPQPEDQQLNVVLSRQPIATPQPASKARLDMRAKAGAKADASADERVDVEIDLKRK